MYIKKHIPVEWNLLKHWVKSTKGRVKKAYRTIETLVRRSKSKSAVIRSKERKLLIKE